MLATYAAYVHSVHDGDTVTATLTIPGVVSRRIAVTVALTEHIRLNGINAPELSTAAGKVSRDWLIAQLAAVDMAITVRVDLDRVDKYGRLIGTLFANGVNLNEAMVNAGLATVYYGYGPKLLKE